jgi:hypothetical protein
MISSLFCRGSHDLRSITPYYFYASVSLSVLSLPNISDRRRFSAVNPSKAIAIKVLGAALPLTSQVGLPNVARGKNDRRP